MAALSGLFLLSFFFLGLYEPEDSSLSGVSGAVLFDFFDLYRVSSGELILGGDALGDRCYQQTNLIINHICWEYAIFMYIGNKVDDHLKWIDTITAASSTLVAIKPGAD